MNVHERGKRLFYDRSVTSSYSFHPLPWIRIAGQATHPTLNGSLTGRRYHLALWRAAQLGQTNSSDRSSKAIYAGTTDILEDFDCGFTIDEVEQSADDRRVVEFECIKQRGNVAQRAHYAYSLVPDMSYADRVSIEAFAAAAHHLSYQGAAVELGIAPSSVKLNVEELERWLHRVLILDGIPLEVNDADNIWFLSTATECLQLFSAHQTKPLVRSPKAARQKSEISSIRLIDLQSLIKTVEYGNFKAAGYEFGSSPAQVRRNIQKLEMVIGRDLIVGRSMIYATPCGEKFTDDANSIIQKLLDSRASLPINYNAEKCSLNQSEETIRIHQNQIANTISQLEKRQNPSKLTRFEIGEGHKTLAKLEELLVIMSDQ